MEHFLLLRNVAINYIAYVGECIFQKDCTLLFLPWQWAESKPLFLSLATPEAGMLVLRGAVVVWTLLLP